MHKRFAFYILYWIGSKPKQLVYGFFIATGFLSMWVNNTSTAMMFLPIAMYTVQIIENKKLLVPKSEQNFSIIIFLSIAYFSSIGGIFTLIGTASNIFMPSFVKENLNIQIQFLDWFKLGLPFFILSIFVVPYIFIKTFSNSREPKEARKNLFLTASQATWTYFQRRNFSFCSLFEVTGWLTQPFLVTFLPFLSDSVLGMVGEVALFLISISFKNLRFLLNEEDIKKFRGMLYFFSATV